MSRLRRALATLLLALAAPAPARAEPAHPALWKLADADTTIYLFGTIHALPPGIDWLNGTLAAALDSSDELVTEIVEPDPAREKALVLAGGVLPGGTTVRAAMRADERAHYEAALATLGMPPTALDRLAPWLAAVTLSTTPLLRHGFRAENGAEATLAARMLARGRARTALETIEYQLGLFETLPADVQRRYLDDVVNELPSLDVDVARMLAAWEAGDADTLAKLVNDDTDDEPMLVERLLTRRNRAWADAIAARLARPGTVFVAVGAGHLGGPGGVIELLRSRGLAVARVQ